jgi:hypothetical protein
VAIANCSDIYPRGALEYPFASIPFPGIRTSASITFELVQYHFYAACRPNRLVSVAVLMIIRNIAATADRPYASNPQDETDAENPSKAPFGEDTRWSITARKRAVTNIC